MLRRHVRHRASECSNGGRRLHSHLADVHLCCIAIPCLTVPTAWQLVQEAEEDQDPNGIEDFVVFSIKSSEGFAFHERGATKTVCGFTSVQLVADPYEELTVETTDGIHVCWWWNGSGKHEHLDTTLRAPAGNFGECCVARVDTFPSVWM